MFCNFCKLDLVLKCPKLVNLSLQKLMKYYVYIYTVYIQYNGVMKKLIQVSLAVKSHFFREKLLLLGEESFYFLYRT